MTDRTTHQRDEYFEMEYTFALFFTLSRKSVFAVLAINGEDFTSEVPREISAPRIPSSARLGGSCGCICIKDAELNSS
jgi:hypothetical protein